MNKEFITMLQKKVGSSSIGPSTARGMGPEGTIKSAREFLQEFDLRTIKARSESSFISKLDSATGELQNHLPKDAQYWGSSRKFMNIFLRNCLYNRYICVRYNLEKIEGWLEVPLDSHVAKGLVLEEGSKVLPRWKTVIGLTKEHSKIFQDFAQSVARIKNTARVHLDLLYWRGAHMANPQMHRTAFSRQGFAR